MSAAERSARVELAVRSKRMSERYEQMSERTSEWPSTYVPIKGLSETPCIALVSITEVWRALSEVRDVSLSFLARCRCMVDNPRVLHFEEQMIYIEEEMVYIFSSISYLSIPPHHSF